MANNVFANGREISCKSGSGKSICVFPDVCMTPPQTPATPPGVPIPYPNTGMASDTTSGSKNVKISDKEVMLKNKSYFKSSTGDEAGSAPLKGVVTHKTKGKVYFNAWSMDVKVEGENIVRHLDLTTHNHGSGTNTLPWPYFDSMTLAQQKKCKDDVDKEKIACSEYTPYKEGGDDVCVVAELSGAVKKDAAWSNDKAKKAKANDCIKARRCRLVPFSKKKDGINGCCPSQTPDHLIPKSSFYKTTVKAKKKVTGWKRYSSSGAPCMCTEGGTNTHGSHGLRHTHHKMNGPKRGEMQTLSEQATLAAEGANKVFPGSKCNQECLKAQLEAGHKKYKSKGSKNPKIKHSPSGSEMSPSELNSAVDNLAPPPLPSTGL